MASAGELERVIGTRALGLTGVNLIVGAGIFGLPALAAGALGPAAVLAYLLCAFMVALVGVCLAEAGSRVSAPGGVYAYAGAAFGPLAASFVGTLMWSANGVVANAAVAVLLANTLGTILPIFQGPVLRGGFLVLLYGMVGAVNVLGVRRGVRLSEVMTAIKLAPLVLLVVAGLPQIHLANLRWSGVPSPGAAAQTSLILLFAFTGIETALSTSGEIRNPARTVPRGILLALGLTTALYLSLQVVAQGVLGSALTSAADAPLVVTAGYVLGEWGTTLLIAATVFRASASSRPTSSPLRGSCSRSARTGCSPESLDRYIPGSELPGSRSWRIPAWRWRRRSPAASGSWRCSPPREPWWCIWSLVSAYCGSARGASRPGCPRSSRPGAGGHHSSPRWSFWCSYSASGPENCSRCSGCLASRPSCICPEGAPGTDQPEERIGSGEPRFA